MARDTKDVRPITTDDIEFLSKLQGTMRTQPDFGQASPRYWGIMDYRYRRAAPDETVDRLYLYSDGSGKPMSCGEVLDKLTAEMVELGGEEYAAEWCDEQDLDFYVDIDDRGRRTPHAQPRFGYLDPDEVYDIWEAAGHANDASEELICETRDAFLVQGPIFITYEGCKAHIASNHYHYDKHAHPFAMTAWRAPEMARLWDILENVDFDRLLPDA